MTSVPNLPSDKLTIPNHTLSISYQGQKQTTLYRISLAPVLTRGSNFTIEKLKSIATEEQ